MHKFTHSAGFTTTAAASSMQASGTFKPMPSDRPSLCKKAVLKTESRTSLGRGGYSSWMDEELAGLPLVRAGQQETGCWVPRGSCPVGPQEYSLGSCVAF